MTRRGVVTAADCIQLKSAATPPCAFRFVSGIRRSARRTIRKGALTAGGAESESEKQNGCVRLQVFRNAAEMMRRLCGGERRIMRRVRRQNADGAATKRYEDGERAKRRNIAKIASKTRGKSQFFKLTRVARGNNIILS